MARDATKDAPPSHEVPALVRDLLVRLAFPELISRNELLDRLGIPILKQSGNCRRTVNPGHKCVVTKTMLAITIHQPDGTCIRYVRWYGHSNPFFKRSVE